MLAPTPKVVELVVTEVVEVELLAIITIIKVVIITVAVVFILTSKYYSNSAKPEPTGSVVAAATPAAHAWFYSGASFQILQMSQGQSYPIVTCR